MYSASCCSRRIGSPVEKHIVNNLGTSSQEASGTKIEWRTISLDQLLVLSVGFEGLDYKLNVLVWMLLGRDTYDRFY